MALQAVLLIAGIIAVVLFARKLNEWQAEQEQEQELSLFDSVKLEREVQALHSDMTRLKQLDDMIIDLRLCKPATAQKAFRMEWMSTAGQNHALDFFADGDNPSTEYLLELAISEREEVNADVLRRIVDLYQRACILDYSAYRNEQ